MSALERLAALFERFPGIGPRQAMRFVMFLLKASPAMRKEIADALLEVGKNVRRCNNCLRFHDATTPLCSMCSSARDSVLMVVVHDTDIAAIERSGTYRGYYFVLGGMLSLGGTTTEIHERELVARLKKSPEITELILALPAQPDGDMTAAQVREKITAALDTPPKITTLGRGLSTGSEIEYADPETIRNALLGRH